MAVSRYDVEAHRKHLLTYLTEVDETELNEILSDLEKQKELEKQREEKQRELEKQKEEKQTWREWLNSVISYFNNPDDPTPNNSTVSISNELSPTPNYTDVSIPNDPSPTPNVANASTLNNNENVRSDTLTQLKFKLENIIKVLEGEDGILFIKKITQKNHFDIYPGVIPNLNSLLTAYLRKELEDVKVAISGYESAMALSTDLMMTNSFIANAQSASMNSVKDFSKQYKKVKQQQSERMNEKEELKSNVNIELIKQNLLKTSAHDNGKEKEKAVNAKINERMEEVEMLCKRSEVDKNTRRKTINTMLFGQYNQPQSKKDVLKEREFKYEETQKQIAKHFGAEIKTPSRRR